MSQLKSTTVIFDTDLSVRALNIIATSLKHISISSLITLADVMDNKSLIFANPNCSMRTKKEINQLMIEYIT